MSEGRDVASFFTYVDYIAFSAMLAVSLGIGVYHSLKVPKTAENFLLASRSMGPVPVAMSLIATYISSISILGVVGEVYAHGLDMIWLLVGLSIGILISIHCVQPIFYELNLKSINQYIEMRFNSKLLMKIFLALTTMQMLIFLGLCLYAPTLALYAVTPLSSTTYVFILGFVVTLYSSFGGIKAVVWTDFFQTIIISFGVLLATFTSIISSGGMGRVWKIAMDHGRIDALKTSLGIFERHTIFNVILMAIINFCYLYSFNQIMVQRIATQRSLRNAKIAMYLNLVGLTSLLFSMFVCGLGIFAIYAGCDPIGLSYIERKDQMLPYYIMDKLGYLKGIPGLFVACLFSGTLSSVSSMLNSLPTMLWVDYLSLIPYFQKASERTKKIATNFLACVIGILMMLLALLSSNFGGLIQAGFVILSTIAGPVMGVYVLGIAVPICGKKGAFVGFFLSMCIMIWLAIGAQLYADPPKILPLSHALCPNNTSGGDLRVYTTTDISMATTESITEMLESNSNTRSIYNISYTLYSPIGFALSIITAIVTTYATGKENPKNIDPKHVVKFLRPYVGPKASQHIDSGMFTTLFKSRGKSRVTNESSRPLNEREVKELMPQQGNCQQV